MESSQFEATPPVQNKKRSGFWFLEVGLLELFFVLVLLVFIFGAMNFLGIIHLNKFLPNLSFLPHIQSTKQPSPTPSGPLTLKKNTDTFAYNKLFAQTKLNDAFAEVLQPQFLPPATTKIEQDFFVDKTGVSNRANAFSMAWQAAPYTFNSYIYFTPQTNTPFRMITFATFPITNQKPTTSEVEARVNSAFKTVSQPTQTFTCNYLGNFYDCFKVITANNNTYWLGEYNNSPTSASLFACILYNSKNYPSTFNCLRGH